MIWLYRVLFLPGLLAALPWYLWRMWRRGGYRRDIPHRFGLVPRLPAPAAGRRRVWVQAVSVGELNAVEPLLRRLHAGGRAELVLTATTSTGLALARRRLADCAGWICGFPLDFWPCSAAAWRRLRPDLVVLVESELWPEHLHQAARRGVPVVLVNARLSDRSFARYRRALPVVRPLLRPLARVLAASPVDARRFEALGLAAPVAVTGNLKVDFDPRPLLGEDERRALLRECGFLDEGAAAPPPLIVGASTWEGEEEALARAWAELREDIPGLRLLLVPRHAERRREVAALARRFDPGAVLRTETPGGAPAGTGIYIADTIGELRRFLQPATAVFIGNSLPPYRLGQTPIEAAAYGKAMVFGPGMDSFPDIAPALLREGAALPVPDAAALPAVLRLLLTDPQRRRHCEEAAHRWFVANRGALDRTWEHLVPLLER